MQNTNECTMCRVLTVWLSCWGRSPEATPDGAPRCCTPLSCRTAGSSRRFSSVRRTTCNRTIPPSRRRRRRSRRTAGKTQTTATEPTAFSHATRKTTAASAKEGKSVLRPHGADGGLISESLCYKKVTWEPDKNETFARVVFGSSEPSSSISRWALSLLGGAQSDRGVLLCLPAASFIIPFPSWRGVHFLQVCYSQKV